MKFFWTTVFKRNPGVSRYKRNACLWEYPRRIQSNVPALSLCRAQLRFDLGEGFRSWDCIPAHIPISILEASFGMAGATGIKLVKTARLDFSEMRAYAYRRPLRGDGCRYFAGRRALAGEASGCGPFGGAFRSAGRKKRPGKNRAFIKSQMQFSLTWSTSCPERRIR